MRDAELVALATVVQCDLAHMVAANEQRRRSDEAPAYTSIYEWAAFRALEAELRRREVLPQQEAPDA